MPKDKRKTNKYPDARSTQIVVREANSLLGIAAATGTDAAVSAVEKKAAEEKIAYTISYDRPTKKIIQEIALPAIMALKQCCVEKRIEPENFYIVLHTLGHGINFFTREVGTLSWEKALNSAWADRVSLEKSLRDTVFARSTVRPLDLHIIDSMMECLKPECFEDERPFRFIDAKTGEPAYNDEYKTCLLRVAGAIESNERMKLALETIKARYRENYRLQHRGAADLTDETIDYSAERYLVSEIVFHIMVFEKYGINTLAYAGKINELVDIEQSLLPDMVLQVMEIMIAYREVEPKLKPSALSGKSSVASRAATTPGGAGFMPPVSTPESSKVLLDVRGIVLK
ncbi:MAG: hypothetical protein V1855_00330 [bacterium]